MSNVINQAVEVLARVEQDVFFAKMAQYGIQPQNEEEAIYLLQRGDALLQLYESGTPAGDAAKTASIDALGLSQRKYASDGFAEEVHNCVNTLMQTPEIVQAVKVALTASVA